MKMYKAPVIRLTIRSQRWDRQKPDSLWNSKIAHMTDIDFGWEMFTRDQLDVQIDAKVIQKNIRPVLYISQRTVFSAIQILVVLCWQKLNKKFFYFHGGFT